jgi:excisionase family DNA binding protein
MKMLTVQETATMLGISPGLVYALCSSKRLRHERHGLGRGKIRIPEDAVEEYRRSVTVAATVKVPQAAAPPAARLQLKHLKL